MPEEAQLDLLLHLDPQAGSRRRRAVAASVLLHAVILPLLPFLPASVTNYREGPQIEVLDLRRSMPLVAPRLRQEWLTQKEPNTGKVGTEFNIADLMPKPPLPSQQSAPAVLSSPAPRAGEPSPAPAPVVVEPPKMETAQADVRQLPGPGIAAAPAAAIQPVEKPKLAFEKVGSSMGSPVSGGAARIEAPKSGLDETIRAAARGAGRGGLVVGDAVEGGPGISEMLGQAPRPGGSRSALELISDPQGVDFRPYLIQVLAAVRRNWFAVMPESARLGHRGRTVIQFSVARDGRVPKLVIAAGSGADALDRAAVAGISAANPFPPLPADFRGAEIRVQFVFSYNMPAR